jgi:glycosyltransferase involved in cell wall biosynthesis
MYTMNILVDCSNTYSGGARTHLRMLATRIPSDTTSVYTFVGEEKILGLVPSDHSRIRKVTSVMLERGKLARHLWRALNLRLLVRKFDLVFFPGGTVTGSPKLSVTMCRNMLPFMPQESRIYGFSLFRLKIVILRIMQLRSMRRATGTIFLSEFAREAISDRLPRLIGDSTARIVMIPHGIADEFRNPKREQYRIPRSESKPISLVYTSTIDIYKNQDIVLLGVKRLREMGWNIDATFIGSSSLAGRAKFDEIRKRVDPGRNWTSVEAEMTHRDLVDVYDNADIFVYASTCENLPNILLEAMAARVPIVCSRSRPMNDVLGSGGTYFEPRDVGSFASAIIEAIESEDIRRERVHKAYCLSEAYDWNKCASETFGFLERIGRDACK